MFGEIVVAFLILAFSFLLIYSNMNVALVVLLLISTLLHKELFSVYRWDVLPVRLFMLAFLGVAILRLGEWLIKRPKRRGPRQVGAFTKNPLRRLWEEIWGEPFVLLLLALWLVRGISIYFSKNLFSSVTLFGFFTTIVALGITLYKLFVKNPQKLFRYIKLYIFIMFGLCLFAYFQAFLYLKFDVIIGALWNVPNNFPRLGATFWDVNHFGALLAGLLPVLGVLILTAKNIKQRGLYSVMFLLMSGLLVLTNSRTAWIIAFISFIGFTALMLYRRFKWRGLGALLLVGFLAAGLFMLEYSDKSSPVRKKVKDFFHYRIDSFDSHFMLLTGAWQVFEEKPFLGGGYGGFFEHFSKTPIAAKYFGRDPAALNTRVPAHTIWGEVLAETGVIGFIIFVAFLFVIFGPLWYLALKGRGAKDRLMGSAMFSALLGWFVAGVFYSYKSEFFWIVLFMYFTYAVGRLGEQYSLEKFLKLFVRAKWFSWVAIFLLGFLLIFVGLGVNHLIPWDEAIYAQIARNMIEFKDFITLRWFPAVDPWYEKPPLYMWLSSITMRILGFNGWGVRLPSAFFGLGTVMLVFTFGKKLFGKAAGFISAFSLLTTFHFLYYSRIGMLDVAATFFVTLCLILYFLAAEKKVLKYWVVSGLACGFAVMVKGVVGFLPLPIIGLSEIYTILSSRKITWKKQIRFYLGFIISSLLVFLPWHLIVYIRGGKAFLDTYIGYHVLSRATVAIEDKGRPFWWYLVVMKVSMRVWFIALLGAFPLTLYGVHKKSWKHIFLLFWGVFVFLFFSIARSKLVWYIIPLYPVVSLMIGFFVEQFLQFVITRIPKLNTLVFKSLFFVGIVIGGLFYLFLNRGLVYRIDLTGPQAKLMEVANKEFDERETILVDRIELPLVLFYLEHDFAVVDFGPLKNSLINAAYDQRIIFITKESRFRTLKNDYDFDTLELVAEEKEWVLGYLPAPYEFAKKDLDEIKKVLDRVESKIQELTEKGEPVSSSLLIDRQSLINRYNGKLQEIDAKKRGI